MKRILSVLLTVAIMLSLVACGDKTSANDDLSMPESDSNNILSSEVASEDDSSIENITSNDSSMSVESSKPVNSSNSSSSANSSSEIASSNNSSHTHSFSPATCTKPKKCSCGATESSALGHTWINATCTTPKTCSVCKTTEGVALGHKFSTATCTKPAKCSCGVTDGAALGHNFSKYKCTLCNTLNPTEKYIDKIILGVDGKGIYGRAGEDFGFVIKEECKDYVDEIDDITASINGVKCKVNLSLSKAEVEKLANDYVLNMGESYSDIAKDYYLPCSAIIGVDYPENIFEVLKPNVDFSDFYACDFIITVKYTLVDGTQMNQSWNNGAVCISYSLGTIPANCFSYTK